MQNYKAEKRLSTVWIFFKVHSFRWSTGNVCVWGGSRGIYFPAGSIFQWKPSTTRRSVQKCVFLPPFDPVGCFGAIYLCVLLSLSNLLWSHFTISSLQCVSICGKVLTDALERMLLVYRALFKEGRNDKRQERPWSYDDTLHSRCVVTQS